MALCLQVAEKHHIDRIQAAVLLLAITIGFYWKLSLSDQYVWFDHPDMCYLEIPRLQFQAHEIHAGHFPLWDPRIWAGQPLIGQTQPGPLFPLNLLFYLFPLRHGYIRFELLNWYWVLVHFLAAWFAYLLCRDLQRSRAASILAGCAFAFGGFVGTVAWLDVVNGAIWTPLIFMHLLRAMRGERPIASAAWCGFWLATAWLCGHHEIPMLASYAVAGFWIWRLIRSRDWKDVRLAAVTFVITGLIAAPQLLPTYEFGQLSKRWIGADEAVGWKDQIPYTIPTVYSMPFKAVIGMMLPGQGSQADSSPFLGIVACALAFFAIAAAWRDEEVRWFTALGALGLAYAFGAFTPLHGVLSSLLPMLNKARIPVRAIHLLNFSLAVLSAYGLDVLLNGGAPEWARRLRLWLAVPGVALLLTPVIFKIDMHDGIFLAGIIACATAALATGAASRTAIATGLIAMALTELNFVGTALYANRYNKDSNKYINALKQHGDVAEFLHKEEAEHGPVRVHVNDTDMPANVGDWHGFDMLQGYVAGFTLNVMRHEFHTKRTQSLFAVTHFISKKPDRPDLQEAFAGEGGLKVWRNPDAMPRVWSVHEAVVAPSDGQLRILIQDPTFDFHRKTVLLERAPRLETCAGEDQVRLSHHGTDSATISVKMPCRGMVILAESNYPGWKATVDHEQARVWEAYGALRGVVVPAGEHTVQIEFRPTTFYVGLALAGLGVLALAAATLTRSTIKRS